MDLQEALGVAFLSRQIKQEAHALPENILQVVDFLNLRVDPLLLDSCGATLASRLLDLKPSKVLTGSSCQGLCPAFSTAKHLGVPLVFAHTCVPDVWKGSGYSTSSGHRTQCVSAECLTAEDRVVIVDDIYATGKTVAALRSICENFGAEVVAIAAIINNCMGENVSKEEPKPRFVSLLEVTSAKDTHPSASFEVTPAVQQLVVPECIAADVLTARILKDGKVLPGNLLKVYSFVNHQVDTALMDMCGQLIARVFAGFGVQKVLTAQTGGLPPAHAVAKALRVPLVCARETHDKDEHVLATMYSATSESFTKKKKLVLYINKESLLKDEVVLLVDDFLATGTTGVALHQLVKQAGAEVAGMAFLIEKCFQDGRGKILRELPHMAGRVLSLAGIESMSESGINLKHSVKAGCEPLQNPPGNVVIEKVLQKAAPAGASGLVDVSSFLNHVVDPSLMDQAASLFTRRFADAGATAIVTAEGSGVAAAFSLAQHLRIPMVCARREITPAMKTRGTVLSATLNGSQDLHILANHLGKDDKVLLIDDILSTGSTALALVQLCKEAGATVVGLGFLVEKTFQGGRDKILAHFGHLADDVVALARVLSVDDQGLKIFRCPEDPRSEWHRVASGLVRRMGAELQVDVAQNVMKFRSLLGFHMSLDPVLLDSCGRVLASQFAGVTKVLTGAPIQGLAVAHAVARHLNVPMIFARTSVPLTMKDQIILKCDAPAGTLHVSAEFFTASDRILVVDDFLATGSTSLALKQMCKDAGASLAGFAFLALNSTRLVGQRHEMPSKSGKEALEGDKVVVLAEVRGLPGAPCQVALAEWLTKSH